ncbi:CD151 antigen-like isoform X2 [Stegodyphus dumicola]|uniref:CD151 antigen-like isoform X2 n=1 Tax=Stegodyphus dumicola TaxID=202533 RepID=UPI0015B266DE|nr:CD151 antigen-like isoform X2 [Stegodyphus dumicola]
MALSCGAKCAKGVLITFNLVFWLSGCALIAFGIFILIEEEKSTLFRLFQVDDNYAHIQYLAFAFIGIGGLVFIVGFFGCCGAMQENKCMLVAYFIFLFIILGSELAVGVMAIIFQDKGVSEMEGKLKETLKTKYGVDQPVTQAFDLAQTKFKCCGVRDPSDYQDSAWKQKTNSNVNVSPTCCVLRNAGQPEAYVNPQPINETLCQREDGLNQRFRHQTGCKYKLEAFLRDESMLFIAIGCGIAALEIFGMIFSICLCKEI